MAIEEEFGLEIPDSEADKVRNIYITLINDFIKIFILIILIYSQITSIAEAVAYVSAHPMAK